MLRKLFPHSGPDPTRPVWLVFANNNVLFLAHRQGANCTSIGQDAGVSLSTIQSLNPGMNCTPFSLRASEGAKLDESPNFFLIFNFFW